MSYHAAARLTLPQLMHALGIDGAATTDVQIAQRLQAMQRRMLDRIARRRRCLPIELLRMPTDDLLEQIRIETNGKSPSRDALPEILARYTST